MFKLTNSERKKEFLLPNPGSYIDITDINIATLFDWEKPDEWAKKMASQGLGFRITADNGKGATMSSPFYLSSLFSLYHFKPKIILSNPIHIPVSSDHKFPKLSDFPLKIEIELLGSVSDLSFDVTFVYNEV